MQIPVTFLCMLALLTLSFSGCGSDADSIADTAGAPEELTLYSIDGRDSYQRTKVEGEEQFHGYPVLGKVEISDAAKRAEIMRAIERGQEQSDGGMAKCFLPRHGIRAIQNGKTVEYVICFECLRLKIIEESLQATKPITEEPQTVLNKHLTDAGIAIAPKPGGDEGGK